MLWDKHYLTVSYEQLFVQTLFTWKVNGILNACHLYRAGNRFPVELFGWDISIYKFSVGNIKQRQNCLPRSIK